MFISEEVKDICDEIELLPERWWYNNTHLINRENRDWYEIKRELFI